MKFIHISDTHFKKDKFDLFGLDPKKRLKKAIRSINKNQKNAKFIIVTGDLTDRGDIYSYQTLKDILDTAKMPVYTIIGNHDERDNYLSVFKDAFVTDGFIQTTKIIKNSVFIFLDTKIENTHAGDMCNQRFDWFKSQLKLHKDKDVYIFMHHPPMDIGIPKMDIVGFKSKQKLKRIFLKNPNIKYLFFGHVHRQISGTWAGVPYSCVKGINHQVSYQKDRDELYFTNEEKPAYNVVQLHKNYVNINSHEFLVEDEYYLADY